MLGSAADESPAEGLEGTVSAHAVPVRHVVL